MAIHRPKRHTTTPQVQLSPAAASQEEAAAIVAALERFMRATAPHFEAMPETVDPWQRAAIAEGVTREPWSGVPDPWINT